MSYNIIKSASPDIKLMIHSYEMYGLADYYHILC